VYPERREIRDRLALVIIILHAVHTSKSCPGLGVSQRQSIPQIFSASSFICIVTFTPIKQHGTQKQTTHHEGSVASLCVHYKRHRETRARDCRVGQYLSPMSAMHSSYERLRSTNAEVLDSVPVLPFLEYTQPHLPCDLRLVSCIPPRYQNCTHTSLLTSHICK
jgi:hypothetical protein